MILYILKVFIAWMILSVILGILLGKWVQGVKDRDPFS